MKLKNLLLLCLFLYTFLANAQDTARVGNPNEAPLKRSEMMPFNGKYDYSWSSVIYTSTEIGMGSGEIAQLGFYIDNNANAIMHNQKIYARLIDETAYGNGNNSNYPGTIGFTEVYSGDITYSGSGKKYIELTNRIEYVEGKSLELLFENRDGNANDNCLGSGNIAQCSPKFRQVESPDLIVRGKRDYLDKGWPETCKMCGGGIRRPIIEIIIPCRGINGGIPIASPTQICSGQTTQITLTNYSPGGSGSTIKWFKTENGVETVLNQYFDLETFSINLSNNSSIQKIYQFRAEVTKTYSGSTGVILLEHPYPIFANCTRSSTLISVVVNPLPTVSANTTSITVCSGEQVTLTGGGAISYSWSDGVTNGVAFAPVATTIYTVTGTDVNSCVNTATVSVNVNELPVVVSTSTTVCSGESATITASGADTYLWNTTDATVSLTINPATTTTTYTVTGTNTVTTCSNTAAGTITVNAFPIPIVNAGADLEISIGDAGVIIGGSPAVSGTIPPYSYQWQPTTFLSNSTVANPSASPTQLITYTLIGTDGNGCKNSDEMVLTVLPGIFFEPKMNIDGMLYETNGVLRLKYTEDYKDNDGFLNYKIMELANKKLILNTAMNQLPVVIGDNRYLFDLSNFSGFTVGKKYLIEIENDKKEKYYLRFVY